MSTAVAAVSGLGAAGFFAAGTALQYRAATDAGPSAALDARAVVAFAGRSARSPRCLLGTLLLAAGLGLHALALHEGALTLVQPLLIVGVLFTLPASRLVGGPPLRAADLRWAAGLVAALAVFLVSATPATQHTGAIDAGPAVVAAGLSLAGIVACVAMARRRPQDQTALVLGVAAGIALAGSAALLKVTSDVAARGAGALVSSWQPYALIAIGAVALALSQLAYRAGPMVTSLPAINVTNPLTSVVIGAAVFDERFRTGALVTVIDIVALAVVLLATAALSRRPAEGAGGDRPSLRSDIARGDAERDERVTTPGPGAESGLTS